MKFYAILAAINITCFLPLYLLNFREQPNPFRIFHRGARASKYALTIFYKRMQLSDPFRVNFDFTFLVLVTVGLNLEIQWIATALGLILSFGFVEILYTTIMHVIFKRPPSLSSDLSLLRAGWSVAYNYRWLLVIAVAGLLATIISASLVATSYLLSAAADQPPSPLAIAVLLLPPCLFHWRRFPYKSYIWRVVYSPTLHIFRNYEFAKKTRRILGKDQQHFEQLNQFNGVEFDLDTRILVICIESYGSIAYDKQRVESVISPRAQDAIDRLEACGYSVASTFSEAPVFSGGSWLSFTTLTYGTVFDDAYLHDGLFGVNSAFGHYESLFHILERNGYSNNLLCPLGGGSSRLVDWDSIDRCFRPKRKFDFDSLNYHGDTFDFFVRNDLYAPPDQFSLNYAYDSLQQHADGPFSLFFCTLNSHYPWAVNPSFVDDWRALKRRSAAAEPKMPESSAEVGYDRAIRYQLDYILEFAAAHADDDLLMIVFGDHQPPFITPESMGRHTPLHVITRDSRLSEFFVRHGFAPVMDLQGQKVEPIKHQGFLSMLMQAINLTYGSDSSTRVEYRPDGTDLLDNA